MISTTTRESVTGRDLQEEDFAEFNPERWLSPSTSPSSSAAAAAAGGHSSSSSVPFYAPFGAVSLLPFFFRMKERERGRRRGEISTK